MENKNNCVKVGSLRILWSVMAILLCASQGVLAQGVDVTVPSSTHESPCDIDYTISGNLNVNAGGTVNLLTGAEITYFLYAWDSSSVVNIKGGQVGYGIAVISQNANITVYGKYFKKNGVLLDPIPNQVTFDSGTNMLFVTYSDDTFTTLTFESYYSITINLVNTAASGPEEITIDIKPGSYPNSINLGSNGVIPVAILSTAELNATTLNAENTFLAGLGVRVRGKGNKYLASEEDVNGDGLIDLVVKVETENLDPGQFAEGGAYLRVHETSDPTSAVLYEGWDEIVIVPPE